MNYIKMPSQCEQFNQTNNMQLTALEILSVVKEVAELKEVQTTVGGVLKGTATVGAFAAAGGLIGGPLGLGVGGMIGSIVSMVKGQGTYKGLPQVIMEDMTEEQRMMLAAKVATAFSRMDFRDVAEAVTVIMATNSLQSLLFNEVSSFLSSEMGRQIILQ